MKGEEGKTWKETPTKEVRSQLWSQAGLGANPQLGLKVTAPLSLSFFLCKQAANSHLPLP